VKRYQTRAQLERTKEKAVRFVRDVLSDSEHAEALESESPESYARRKRIQIINPTREGRKNMATGQTKSQLEATLNSAYDKLQEAYDPRLSREQMAVKVGEVLDELVPDEDFEEDDDEGSDAGDDDDEDE
jgi:hypothetical protein